MQKNLAKYMMIAYNVIVMFSLMIITQGYIDILLIERENEQYGNS